MPDYLNEPIRREVPMTDAAKSILTDALEEADLAVKAKNAFLSHISHEMRTPLNAIFGFTTLAKTNIKDPAIVAEYLDQIEAASHQLLDMVTKALDASALSDTGGDSQEKCDLCDTLDEVYRLLLPRIEEKSIQFSLDCKNITHRGVYTNPVRLKQMILNLADNAVTYTEHGGTVTVTFAEEKTLSNDRSVYRLEVMDTGIGIGEEFLERLFEPFSRETSSTLSGIHGIGLGLTIVENIVDALGGTISVDSSVGKGSVFTVILPFHVQLLSDASEKQNTRRNSSLRILLVEDNDLNREIETELLARKGFAIDPVANGKAALEKMENASPGDYDLMILDIQMPEMDGWQVAAAIRKLPNPALANIPIIALSANVQISDFHRSLDSGIDVHLPKPMDVGVLLDTIEKLCAFK